MDAAALLEDLEEGPERPVSSSCGTCKLLDSLDSDDLRAGIVGAIHSDQWTDKELRDWLIKSELADDSFPQTTFRHHRAAGHDQ